MTRAELLLHNLAKVEDEISEACSLAGRDRDSVRLLAVSKFHPQSDIAAVASGGQLDIGENYVQEAEEKKKALSASFPDLRWHMIGHVQRRKASLVAGEFALIHTLDSSALADALEKRLDVKERRQPVLIEVNIADEPQKAGLPPGDLEELAIHVLEHCPHLKLEGLMCLPPVFDSGEAARPFFSQLRQLRDELSNKTGLALPELSMGMSGDFQGAIKEGSTIVRIGTEIFGPRPLKA